MRNLRAIRIFLATLFFVATAGCLFLGLKEHPLSVAAMHSQIIPSMVSMTLGATIFWIVATWCLGRVYCSTVCPVGTLQDLLMPLRRIMPGARHTYRFKPAKGVRFTILIIYICFLLAGLAVVPLILEPWHIMENIAGSVRRGSLPHEWTALGFGVGVGVAAGIVSLLSIALCAIYFGRDFCNVVCPLGTLMSLADPHTLYHIEIDPDKCSGCLRCEESCRASCIKVVSRYVDNSRCVRCFDCLAVCPDNAIRFQRDRNRAATPMMRRVNRAGKN